MRIYEVDVGARYWVAAPDLFSAFELMRKCWESEGSEEDVRTSDSISIDELPEARIRSYRIRMDDDTSSVRSLWDVFQEVEQPEVLGCSEWP